MIQIEFVGDFVLFSPVIIFITLIGMMMVQMLLIKDLERVEACSRVEHVLNSHFFIFFLVIVLGCFYMSTTDTIVKMQKTFQEHGMIQNVEIKTSTKPMIVIPKIKGE